jgi:hypothetical protein
MAKFWAQRIFWLNLIGFLLQLGQYLAGQNFWPSLAVPLAIVLVALQIIANMIGGGAVVASLKNQAAGLKIALKNAQVTNPPTKTG